MNYASHSAKLNATTVRSIRTSYLIASSLLGYENKSTVLCAQIRVTSLKRITASFLVRQTVYSTHFNQCRFVVSRFNCLSCLSNQHGTECMVCMMLHVIISADKEDQGLRNKNIANFRQIKSCTFSTRFLFDLLWSIWNCLESNRRLYLATVCLLVSS